MLTVQSVSYGYQKSKQILKDINLELHPGRIYGLLGLNGEGKTTLIKVLEGMLLPQGGTVQFNQISSTERSAAYHDQIFFLPDETSLPELRTIDFGKTYGNFYSRFNPAEFAEYLEAFQIPNNSNIRSLSLGQRRKVHLSFALACNSSVLLMDEPTNGLDIPSKTVFRKLLAKSMNEEKTYVISSHQIRDIDQLLEHLLILKNGHLILDQSIESIAQEYQISHSVQDSDEIIYESSELNGSTYLIKNKSNTESRIDIEFLFNAINHTYQAVKS